MHGKDLPGYPEVISLADVEGIIINNAAYEDGKY